MAKSKASPSQEFLEKKEILELEGKFEKEKFDMKMLQLKFMRESNRIDHENELTRMRIRTAEIQKTQERRLRYANKMD